MNKNWTSALAAHARKNNNDVEEAAMSDILFDYQIKDMIEALEWAAKSGNYDDPNHIESMADAIVALEKVKEGL